MVIEIVDFPMKNGDSPVRYVSLPEGNILILSYLHDFDHGFDQDANPHVLGHRRKTEKLRKERPGQVTLWLCQNSY